MPCCEANRRDLARKSKMESEGVSSINKGAFSKFLTLMLSCSHSCFSNFPVLSFSEDKPVSDEIKRVINCTEDISSENKATGWPKSIAIFRAIDNTKAVLPIPGRAAMIIKSEGCQPEVILSNFSKPVAIPLKPSLLAISSMRFLACNTKLWAVSELRLMLPCVTSYKRDSALSNKSNTSVVSS